MTKEEQHREYMRVWREKNRDKIREQKIDNARRKALADLKSTSPEAVDMCIIRTWNSGEFHIVRRRR